MSTWNKYMLLWILCGLLACSKPQAQEPKWPDQQTLIKFTEKHVGKAEYKRIFLMANDSINTWRKAGLASWAGDTTKGDAKLDSMFCINSARDKIVMLILARDLSDGKLDGIGYFYGAMVRDKWYFFGGPTQYIYRKDLTQPTSFSTLHEQAVQHIFRAYLKADSTGKWQINERFFGDLTSRAYCASCQTQDEWDAAYLQLAHNIWRYGREPANARPNRESSLSIEPTSAPKPK